ncbi:MAG: flagellar protein FlgN [Lawsonibacter sp.]|jgi:hypothetical protein|uniref:flagellar export chaperone FlgN n=1 Tax=Lawsonibacter sp. JLR.KK007 TaxID=3114293 RepID=UPI00216CA05A|nr:flagellar protein FlgN [Lawsonibacter sp.]MCI8989263.1 flagellar protein FlgN [Lawsonibacter sp.]MCI9267798.1 flagellar protein FlgN [Lawsonibacter sp.]
MTQWQEYLKLLSGLSRTLEQLTKVEQDKKTAASQGDLAGVEDCMKQEQVLSLSLRGYDQRRDKMLASLGLQGVPLNQLEDHSPPDLMLETRRTVEELRRQYTLFQAASQAARNTLEINLREIERIMAVQAGDAGVAEEKRKGHQTDFRA